MNFKPGRSSSANDFCLIKLHTKVPEIQGLCPGSEVCESRLCLPDGPPTAGAACWWGGWVRKYFKTINKFEENFQGDENYYYDSAEYEYDSFYQYEFASSGVFRSAGINIFPEWYARASAESEIIDAVDFARVKIYFKI